MIDFDNQTTHNIHSKLFEPILDYISDQPLELLLVDDKTIQQLNLEHRRINKATDVLSFPLHDAPFLGTIVISTDHAQKISQTLVHTIEDELRLLFIHGLLHLLGFDHETDDGQMRQEEERIISYFSLPTSLIVRNS
jgi:probable rRNA maturation factor